MSVYVSVYLFIISDPGSSIVLAARVTCLIAIDSFAMRLWIIRLGYYNRAANTNNRLQDFANRYTMDNASDSTDVSNPLRSEIKRCISEIRESLVKCINLYTYIYIYIYIHIYTCTHICIYV